MSTALPVSLSALSLFTFLFLTPWGLLALYLGLSGVYRAVAAATGDLRGDPLLSVLDGVHHRRRAAARNDRVARARERAEGSAVPDVLLRGADAGVPDALYVLVASRRKDGWEPGVFVVTPLQWYRIGPAFDRRFPRGLRTLYPLHEVGAVEVLRRSVAYDLPRLSAIDPATLETSILPDPAPGEE